MADPFGTGAGIVGVIGLAIQITQVVVQFGMDWKEAPDNIKTFMAELGTLKTVLSETNTNILLNPDFEAAFQSRPSLLLSQLGPNAPETIDTKRLLEICQRELEYLLKELKTRGQGHRLGWERFKNAFLAKDTRDSVENLCRQCQTLNGMLSIDAVVLGATTYKEVREARKEQQEWRQIEEKNSYAMKSGIDQSNQWQESQDCQAILNWLTPINCADQQSDFINRRQPGIPGAGKTILTSIVIKELTTCFHDDKSIGIAYIYCNFRRQDEQKIDDLLASLLKQLAECQPSLPASVKDLYDRHKKKRTRPSPEEFAGALQSIGAKYSRLFIIIDALDECQASSGCRQRLLSEIFSLQAKVRANIFATSRFIPEITEKSIKCVSLEIRASIEDIQRYLRGHMSQLPAFVGQRPDLQEEIINGITNATDGMFLLGQLHLDAIKGKRSPKAIRATLQNLATGSDAYDYAYTDAMKRIEGQLADQEQLAKQVLSWITCARRPLTITELQHALGVEVGESKLDEDNLSEIEDMISVCAGLVTVDEESRTIRLVHYTTQEYFNRKREKLFPNIETEIAITCVTYLSFDEFQSGICQNDKQFEERLRLHCFYSYASYNWGHHAREASTLIPEVISFLERKPQTEASGQALLAVKRWPGYTEYSQEVSKQITGLHLAAHFGIKTVVKVLLEKGAHVTTADQYGKTPLHEASENGHVEVVKLLLEKGADIHINSRYGRTPLFQASANGHIEVFKLLLEKGVDIDIVDQGWTPLLWASRNGHVEVVQLLLEKGVDINTADQDGRTPPYWASKNRRDEARRVIEKEAHIHTTNQNGWTPLFLASGNGYIEVVKLLLEKGANIDTADRDGWTPLYLASSKGHVEVVQLLLEKGADIDTADRYGRTPLYRASENGHVEVVKLLLETGIDIDTVNQEGWTLLYGASKNGHVEVVKLLLEKGADIDTADRYGRTPIFPGLSK